MSDIDTGLDESDSSDADCTIPNYSNRKRRILILLLVYSAVLGLSAVYLPEDDRVVDVALGLPMLIMLISWCYIDAGQRNHVIGRIMRASLVLLFALAFPIYIFQTRGLKGFISLALTAVFMAAMAACGLAGVYVGIFFYE